VADATEKMRMAMHDWDTSALRADNDLRAYIHAQQKPVGIPSSATPSAIPFRCIVAVTHNPAVYGGGGCAHLHKGRGGGMSLRAACAYKPAVMLPPRA
jgi:hypothetical protein